MKTVFFLLFFLLMVGVAFACKPSYLPDENVTIFDNIISVGENASCGVNIFNKSAQVVNNASMSRDGLLYTYNAGILPETEYEASFICYKNSTRYTGSCSFVVEETRFNITIANLLLFIAFLSVLIGFMFRIPAVSMVMGGYLVIYGLFQIPIMGMIMGFVFVFVGLLLGLKGIGEL